VLTHATTHSLDRCSTFIRTAIKFILFLFLSSCATKKSAEINTVVKYKLKNTAEIFDAKNLSYIGLQKYCIGGFRIEKRNENDCENCKSKNEFYIFWNENNKTFVQKFDNCSEFYKVEISNLKPIEFLKTNSNELKLENIKPYQIDDETYSSVSHSCFRNYVFNDGQNKYEKEFDIYDLTGENENLNYKSNNGTKLIKLDKQLNGIIAELENKNQFERNKKTCYNTVYN
jgi:hypothetical protein